MAVCHCVLLSVNCNKTSISSCASYGANYIYKICLVMQQRAALGLYEVLQV